MTDRQATTAVLEITNEGAADTAVLLHGFPYDVRAYDEVVPILAKRGYQVVVPYLRGFGGAPSPKQRLGGNPRLEIHALRGIQPSPKRNNEVCYFNKVVLTQERYADRVDKACN